MPNGGAYQLRILHIQPSYAGAMLYLGIEMSPFILCRAFRRPKQSHTEARKKWPMLNDLKPGVVYKIDNSAVLAGNPEPVYKVQILEKEDKHE